MEQQKKIISAQVIYLSCALFWASLSFPAFGQQLLSEQGFALRSITIERQQLAPLSLRVEVADSARLRAKGLMFREALTDSDGMLFLWQDTAVRQFWMKDTPLSLDILFFDRDGVLIHHEDAQPPYSEQLISSLMPTSFVLELEAGMRLHYQIEIGDRLIAKP